MMSRWILIFSAFLTLGLLAGCAAEDAPQNEPDDYSSDASAAPPADLAAEKEAASNDRSSALQGRGAPGGGSK